jgi:biopolymer transport protein ExbD
MATALRSDINVTPLVDIVLVLLIVFITLVPALPRVLSAALPVPGPKASSLPLLRLSLPRDGRLEVVGQPGVSLASVLDRCPERIILRVHPDLPLSVPTKVLDDIKGRCPGARVAVLAGEY